MLSQAAVSSRRTSAFEPPSIATGRWVIADWIRLPVLTLSNATQSRPLCEQESASTTSAPAKNLESRVAGLFIADAGPSGGKGDGGDSATPGPSAGTSNAEDERGALEKKLRALKKKVRGFSLFRYVLGAFHGVGFAFTTWAYDVHVLLRSPNMEILVQVAS